MDHLNKIRGITIRKIMAIITVAVEVTMEDREVATKIITTKDSGRKVAQALKTEVTMVVKGVAKVVIIIKINNITRT